ncbi:MAG TPA: DNA repair protein RecN [Gammaproteobacteria bacterium]|nr:DNA repair protein RecN [Gammaproteobacteria bacterium]
MLTHLQIRDFAIIDALELEFSSGMTALTGETGAGKSILVDALGLVLGDRADSTTVRHGADKAEISAEFSLAKLPAARQWLEAQELEADEDHLLLRRVISADGRSRAFINGRNMPVQILKELGNSLVDIHGQHEHQSLTRRSTQLALLDNYGNHSTELAATAESYQDWHASFERLNRLQADAADRDNRLDILRFQVQELESLALQPGEYERLNEEHHRLANAGKLIDGAQRALSLAYENDDASAQQLLSTAVEALQPLLDADPRLEPIHSNLNTALIHLQEGAEDLRHYTNDLEMDPGQLDAVETRIAAIQQLARKHHADIADLPALTDTLREELDSLENADVSLAKLQKQVAQQEQDYCKAATALHTAREKTAQQLGKKISDAMQGLGMNGGRFAVNVTAADNGANNSYTTKGWDKIEFQVSANPGQPLQPLAKVASGGELSRIALAIQVIAAQEQSSAIPSMIFDEVDAGVGGGVAEIVGQKLRELGTSCQVLCVTHLPQVAAQAHHQFKVEKTRGKDTTHTQITPLDNNTRIEELARMLGGVKITETTRRHAEEMIAGAKA